jgi:hypothetical protein
MITGQAGLTGLNVHFSPNPRRPRAAPVEYRYWPHGNRSGDFFDVNHSDPQNGSKITFMDWIRRVRVPARAGERWAQVAWGAGESLLNLSAAPGDA